VGREYEAELRSVLEKIGTEESRPTDSSVDLTGTASEGKVGTEPSPPRPFSARNLFVHHDTHPVVFDIVLLKQYQEDWFTWEAETLWREIKEDFRVPSISDHSKAKIQAIKTLHINEWYWTKWEVFCWVTQSVNNNIPDFSVLQKPSIPQLFNAVEIASMVRKDEEFGSEVQMFVASSVVEEGVFYAPEPIAFCQDEVVQLLDELKIDDAAELISSVEKRFDQVMKISPEKWVAADGFVLQEVPEDIQSAKLKVAQDYLALRRRQLQAQLRLLR
jgi:hypothetical protein